MSATKHTLGWILVLIGLPLSLVLIGIPIVWLGGSMIKDAKQAKKRRRED